MTEDEYDDGWTRGFPTESGMYHVLLNDGEQIITRWNSGGGVDTWGDVRVLGWVCLSDWRGRVYGWRCLPELPRGFKPLLATLGAAPSGDIWRADTTTDGPRIVPMRLSNESSSAPSVAYGDAKQAADVAAEKTLRGALEAVMRACADPNDITDLSLTVGKYVAAALSTSNGASTS